jgi:hypothetical protein
VREVCAIGKEANNKGTRGRSGRGWKGGNNKGKGFFFSFYFGGGG